jgi:hypothetical protein
MKMRLVNIQNEVWKITINNDNELSFSHIVPYSRTIYATNPLWYSWDMKISDHDSEFENYVKSIGSSNINIFKIKSSLLKEIVNLIKQYDIKFFYFYANTDKKRRMYNKISKELIDMLGVGWDVQFINEWYYFYKTHD